MTLLKKPLPTYRHVWGLSEDLQSFKRCFPYLAEQGAGLNDLEAELIKKHGQIISTIKAEVMILTVKYSKKDENGQPLKNEKGDTMFESTAAQVQFLEEFNKLMDTPTTKLKKG